MRIHKLSFSICSVAISFATVGCFRNLQVKTDGDGASGLSEVKIQAPDEKTIRDQFGKNCEDVKITNADSADRCPFVMKMLSHYRLSIGESKCDAGVTGSKISSSGPIANSVLKESVQKGCDYDLFLEIGALDSAGNFEALFTNQSTKNALVSKQSLESGKANVKVKLEPNILAISRGFPVQGNLATDPNVNSADLSIDIEFGKRNAKTDPPKKPSDDPSVQPNPDAKKPIVDAPINPTDPSIVDPSVLPTRVFQIECTPVPFAVAQFDKIELSISGKELVGKRVLSSDPQCEDAAKTLQVSEATASVLAVKRPDLGSGAFEVDLQLKSHVIELFSDQGVALWVKSKTCGLSNWSKAKKVDVIAVKSVEPACTQDFLTIVRAFDIMRLNSDGSLQVGRKLRDAGDGMTYVLGLTKEDRPKEWGRVLQKVTK